MNTSTQQSRKVAADTRNIHPDRTGLRVMVRRNGMTYHAHVLAHSEEAYTEARRLRDRFLSIVGPIVRRGKERGPYRKPRSNTGIVGISEVCRWKKSKPHDAFAVHWRESLRPKMKYIEFGPGLRTREAALRMAIEVRRAAGAVMEVEL